MHSVNIKFSYKNVNIKTPSLFDIIEKWQHSKLSTDKGFHKKIHLTTVADNVTISEHGSISLFCLQHKCHLGPSNGADHDPINCPNKNHSFPLLLNRWQVCSTSLNILTPRNSEIRRSNLNAIVRTLRKKKSKFNFR